MAPGASGMCSRTANNDTMGGSMESQKESVIEHGPLCDTTNDLIM